MSAVVTTAIEAPRKPSVLRMLMRDVGGTISLVLVVLILFMVVIMLTIGRDMFRTAVS